MIVKIKIWIKGIRKKGSWKSTSNKILSFEKNTSTQIWEISVELNSSYSLFLSEDRLAENLRISRYSDKEIKVKKENVNEVKYIKNIELIYLREEN